MSLRELSFKTGIGKSTINNIENQKKFVNIDAIRVYSKSIRL
ncbi:helix-turn-helix domain-containing protein [Bacteroides acidifaciens]